MKLLCENYALSTRTSATSEINDDFRLPSDIIAKSEPNEELFLIYFFLFNMVRNSCCYWFGDNCLTHTSHLNQSSEPSMHAFF